MQKWKIMIATAIALLSSGSYADDVVNNGENPAAVPAPVQEHISKLMQDDVEYNEKLRELSHLVVLAKLRLEIAKIKSEASELSAPPPVNNGEEKSGTAEAKPPVALISPPRVLMLSQIAGVTKAAVSVGTKTIFVRIGELFAVNGKRYVVHQDKSGQRSFVQEVPQ